MGACLPLQPVATGGDVPGAATKGAEPLRMAVIDSLIIAGWTGRDPAGVAAHIAELERLGVRPPRSTPMFYRVAAANLTTLAHIEVAGSDSTGEVECVVFSLPGGIWLGLGSDHTDRRLEAVDVTLSKQLCAKPVSSQVWPFDEIADHYEELILRSWAVIDGERRLYQEGAAAHLRHPRDLMAMAAGNALPVGTAMFCGTLPVRGEIRFASRFEMELHDPVFGRRIQHAYDIRALPDEG